ncbi:TrbM/KikA/MpfK family conjugal transfer protein [Escherichia coli]|nr:TrbM/KikA/MpfK family conjugal transfer protein [Escherichia coli]MDY9818326.1 TrbM/KikA/MpfK family conjugal transfer protein [Escherichia coli]
MKKFSGVCLLSLFMVFSFSPAASAADACKTVLCLYGKAVGSGGGGECQRAEKDFFNILKKKKGSIRWNKTVDARKTFLNQCSSADPTIVSNIMSKYGKVKL